MDHPFVRAGEIVQTGPVALDAVYADFERDGRRHRRFPDDLAHDVAAVAGDLGGLYDDVLGDAPAAPRRPRLEILCLLEQTPDAESRVSLSRGRDALGLQRVQVDCARSS